MKVAELIAALAAVPQDAEVILGDDYGDEGSSIDGVEVIASALNEVQPTWAQVAGGDPAVWLIAASRRG